MPRRRSCIRGLISAVYATNEGVPATAGSVPSWDTHGQLHSSRPKDRWTGSAATTAQTAGECSIPGSARMPVPLRRYSAERGTGRTSSERQDSHDGLLDLHRLLLLTLLTMLTMLTMLTRPQGAQHELAWSQRTEASSQASLAGNYKVSPGPAVTALSRKWKWQGSGPPSGPKIERSGRKTAAPALWYYGRSTTHSYTVLGLGSNARPGTVATATTVAEL